MSDGKRPPTPTWRELRDRLEDFEFRPSKKLGQNFLVDPQLARAIAHTIDVDDADTLIVEVGAGPGSLTRELVARGRVLAFEIDARLAAFLRDDIESWPDPNVRLVECDVLQRGRLSDAFEHALREELERLGAQSWVCISNLPYSSAGPFTAAMLQAERPPRDGVVLTQWEFGERLAAAPGSSEYGSLSVQARLGYTPELLRRVPPDVFRPRPRVDSSLVRLGAPRDWLMRPAEERAAFGRFVQTLFASRRKVLRRGLEVAGVADCSRLDAELLRRRPDSLSPDEFLALWEAVR